MGFARNNPTPPASHAVCPKCGHARDGTLDSLQTDDDRETQEGDCTVCAKCITVLVFQSNLTMIEMTEEELDSFSSEEKEALTFAIEFTRKYSPFYEK